MPAERRLNIRVSDDTHYWLNLDAARHGRSLQVHVNSILSERAASVSEQFGNVRPENRKGGILYSSGGLPADLCADKQREG